jgi:hypothetical protein
MNDKLIFKGKQNNLLVFGAKPGIEWESLGKIIHNSIIYLIKEGFIESGDYQARVESISILN